MNAEIEGAFREAVKAASARADVRSAVAAIYDSLQDAIDLRKPLCKQSGRCCRFDEYDHQLFVTTIELATFVHENPAARSNNRGGCPFQVDGLCSVHPIRPFGCRIFFCDPTATEWQHGQYERFHQHLKRLHDELKVPYFYLEWRCALAAVGYSIVDPDKSALTRLAVVG